MSSAAGFGKPAVAFQTYLALVKHMTSVRGGGSASWVGKVVPRPRSLDSVSSWDITDCCPLLSGRWSSKPGSRAASEDTRNISFCYPPGETLPRQGRSSRALGGWVFVGDDTPTTPLGQVSNVGRMPSTQHTVSPALDIWSVTPLHSDASSFTASPHRKALSRKVDDVRIPSLPTSSICLLS